MTPEAVIYKFLSRFSIPAYAATSVPSDAEFPYITYELATGAFWDGETSLPVSVWYRSDSESEPNAKAREISKMIGTGVMLACDGGGIWIKRGSPFCQSLGDSADDKVKRRYINLTLEFITLN